MCRCKKCGSEHVIKMVKTTTEEYFYHDSELPNKTKVRKLTLYKCHNCGSKSSVVKGGIK